MHETQQMPVLHTPRPGLLCSGQPVSDAWPALVGAGVRTVINLCSTAEQPGRDEAREVAAAGLGYVHIPVAGAADLTRASARRLQDALLSSPASVLVHCGSANRAGALIALADGWFGSANPESALALGHDSGLRGLTPVVRNLLLSPS